MLSSEHDQTKEHQNHVLRVAERTLSLPYGRAMYTFGSVTKVTRESHAVPKIEYSIKIVPLNITVTPEGGKIGPESMNWGEFHNGVAAGLRIAPTAKGVESSWIAFNRPSELTPEHAGFLFALGLTGHLKELMTWHTFQYLTPKHDLTSIAVLLGLAASHIGKGTQKVVKLIAVHTPALLPVANVDLNVSLLTQTAGLSALGLLYMGTKNRRMAEVCLGEISRKDLVQQDLSNEHREAYTFSAAIAFGMIMLGKGSLIPADLDLVHRLTILLHGDVTRRPCDKPINPFDINLTSPAAAIALGLMYLKTNRQDIADMLTIPDTAVLLNRIPPHFLLIRVIAKGMIMWNNVQPTKGWVIAQIPPSLAARLAPLQSGQARVHDDAYELAYYHLVAGCCFVLGLKYAGTASQDAYSVILDFYEVVAKLVAPTGTSDSYGYRHGPLIQFF
jgi:anaphase-promoting complex subunit 1